jgi:hypothetical protein
LLFCSLLGKLILSLISGAAALVSLGMLIIHTIILIDSIHNNNNPTILILIIGFTSQYGGLSTSSKLLANIYEDLLPNSYKAANALAAGYGFGTAVFFFAFVLVYIYISSSSSSSSSLF